MKRSGYIPALLCAVPVITIMTAGCSKVEETSGYTEIPVPADSLSVNESENISSDVPLDDSRYIYSQLSPKEKEYYDIIRDAAMNFEDKAVFPEALDPELLRKLYISVYYQEERIFWLSSMFYRPASESDTLMLTYRFTETECAELQAEIDAETAEIFSSFNDDTSDYEKLKRFHDQLVLNCTFSMDTDYVNTIYGALCDGYAQCEGYAFAFDYLCSLADIDCFTLSGTNSEGALHAWNVVKLEDMWYNVDCTWDDPILSPVDEDFVRYYYFLASDSDISGVTHFPDNKYYSFPICSSGENYYKREGYLADSADEGISLLSKSAADALNCGRKDAAVRFSDEKAYNDAVSKLFDLGDIKQVFKYANECSDVRVTDKKYVRYLNDDELIIHITMI
ncbi:MAG: transglutaminase domain-containing protein, partial [Huintestinicola sp.]